MAAKRKAQKKAATATRPDPRSPIKPTAQACKQAVAAVRALVETFPVPDEPKPADLVYGMLHFIFADGLSCGHGQEAVRRIEDAFVNRNEFRVTEAYQIAELLGDLDIPDLFERCSLARDAVAQVYNDQNAVSLDFVREASVTELKHFFMRAPAITPAVSRFLVSLVSFEECVFSTKSTQRVQMRLGFDPKSAHIKSMFEELAVTLKPFGHVPLVVGRDRAGGKIIGEPALCPTCTVLRLTTKGRR